MPRLVLLTVSSMIIACLAGSAFGQQWTAEYHLSTVQCSRNLPEAQINIFEEAINDASPLLVERWYGNKMTFGGGISSLGAATVEGDEFVFEYSTAWSITFAGPPDPDEPMHGFGWGALPSYASGSFESSGFFPDFPDEATIVFQDSYTFGNGQDYHVECEHEWINTDSYILAAELYQVLRHNVRTLEEILWQMESIVFPDKAIQVRAISDAAAKAQADADYVSDINLVDLYRIMSNDILRLIGRLRDIADELAAHGSSDPPARIQTPVDPDPPDDPSPPQGTGVDILAIVKAVIAKTCAEAAESGRTSVLCP